MFGNWRNVEDMATMNISLPADLKGFAERQAAQSGYSGTSDYVRELIRRDQERLALKDLLLAGAASPSTEPALASYFDGLRSQVRARVHEQR